MIQLPHRVLQGYETNDICTSGSDAPRVGPDRTESPGLDFSLFISNRITTIHTTGRVCTQLIVCGKFFSFDVHIIKSHNAVCFVIVINNQR